MYYMLDCLTKIKQLIWIWLMGMMLKEQLKQSNSDNFNQVRYLFIFHLPFVMYAWNVKPYDQCLIFVYGGGKREVNC